MFSKRHYDFLARAICAQVTDFCDPSEVDALTSLARNLAEQFARDNPNFKPAAWYAACGVQGPVNILA